MTKSVDRRTVLRGMLGGAVVSLGLPVLECYLSNSGTAFASGAPIPVRFGTWFWGMGMNKRLFTPDKVGPNFDLKEELAAIAPVKQHINVLSNYRVSTDGRPSLCHYTGQVALRCGQAPADRLSVPGPSVDVIISDSIGEGNRFKSLEMTATGDRTHSWSFRNAQAVNPPEVSPLALYQRVFGSDFQDPNSGKFQPNPELMLRKSVISAVQEDRDQLIRKVSSADRVRLDEYFTSLRGLEQRLSLQLEKPAPAVACRVPKAPGDVAPTGMDVDLLSERHRLMTDILVNVLACNQTRIFNMAYSNGGTTRNGTPETHHVLTHEEPMNAQGFQPTNSWFLRRTMQDWSYFVSALAAVREGDRTLLDNTLVFAHSDQELAKTHSIDGIPMMTAGGAGGRIKSGIHVDGREALASQVGLTLMRAMGLERENWGADSMKTGTVVDGILV